MRPGLDGRRNNFGTLQLRFYSLSTEYLSNGNDLLFNPGLQVIGEKMELLYTTNMFGVLGISI